MKVPHRIKVDRQWYTVVYGDPAKAAKDKFAAGFFDPYTHTITLKASLRTDPKQRDWVFMHEVMHAVEHEYGLALRHQVLDRIGRAMAYLAEDNGLDFRASTSVRPRGRGSKPRRLPGRR